MKEVTIWLVWIALVWLAVLTVAVYQNAQIDRLQNLTNVIQNRLLEGSLFEQMEDTRTDVDSITYDSEGHRTFWMRAREPYKAVVTTKQLEAWADSIGLDLKE